MLPEILIGVSIVGLVAYSVWRVWPAKAIASARPDAEGCVTLQFTPVGGRTTILWVRYRWKGKQEDVHRSDEPPRVDLELTVKASRPAAQYRDAPKTLWSGTLNATQGGSKFLSNETMYGSTAKLSARRPVVELEALPEGSILTCTGKFQLGVRGYELLELYAAPGEAPPLAT